MINEELIKKRRAHAYAAFLVERKLQPSDDLFEAFLAGAEFCGDTVIEQWPEIFAQAGARQPQKRWGIF